MKQAEQARIVFALAVFAVLALLVWGTVSLVGGLNLGKANGTENPSLTVRDSKDAAEQIDELMQAKPDVPGIGAAKKASENSTQTATQAANNDDVWALFANAAILGDVRAADFARYGYVEQTRVFAGESDTMQAIGTHLSALTALQPDYIFLCYGLNDASVGIWNTPEEYANALILEISQLNQAVPNATVVVSSILPVQEPALSQTPQWQNLPQLSAAVESACVEYGIRFAACDTLVRDNTALYGTDGIRLEQSFYPLWAKALSDAATR